MYLTFRYFIWTMFGHFWHILLCIGNVPKLYLNTNYVPDVPEFQVHDRTYICSYGLFTIFCLIFDINPYFCHIFVKPGPFCRRDTEPGTIEDCLLLLACTKTILFCLPTSAILEDIKNDKHHVLGIKQWQYLGIVYEQLSKHLSTKEPACPLSGLSHGTAGGCSTAVNWPPDTTTEKYS